MNDAVNDVYLIPNSTEYLIVVFKEVTKTSLSQSIIYFKRLKAITKNKSFHYIVDISKTEIPPVEVRNYIKEELQKIDARILSYNIFVGNNFLQKITLKFIGASTGLKNHRSFNSIKEAIYHIEKKYTLQ